MNDRPFIGVDKSAPGGDRTHVTVQYTDQFGNTTTATQPATGLSPSEQLDLQTRMVAQLREASDAHFKEVQRRAVTARFAQGGK